MQESRCRSCGANVLWVGRTILDAVPVDNGNIEIIDGVIHVASKLLPLSADRPRYVSHFSTCPQAKEWRKR